MTSASRVAAARSKDSPSTLIRLPSTNTLSGSAGGSSTRARMGSTVSATGRPSLFIVSI